jgi:protein-S-isoprenylcysteine O-methyltransferase Ste14
MSEPLSHFSKVKVAVPVAFLLIIFAFFVLAIFLVGGSLPRIIGALVTFISSILWIIARVQLGDAPNEGRLVTTGLYGEVRHPIYYFSTLAFLGVAIFMWIGILFIPVAVIAVFQFFRIRREEKALAQKLGRRYLRYKERTII